jgi:hypothetical protein
MYVTYGFSRVHRLWIKLVRFVTPKKYFFNEKPLDYRNFQPPGLPELTTSDFSKLPLADYGWIHFEGRNVENVAEMAGIARRIGAARVSAEVEKLGRIYDDILPSVDVVFVSKEFSVSKGETVPSHFVDLPFCRPFKKS